MSALATALAAELLSGRMVRVVCVWCLHRLDPHETMTSRRCGPAECDECPYVGRDCHLIALPRRSVLLDEFNHSTQGA